MNPLARRAVLFWLLSCLLLLLCRSGSAAPPPVVVISVDGLMPEYLLRADARGLKIPQLRRLLAEGAHARAVLSVLPTTTYPSHATMLTGVAPSRHGVVSNRPFDPLDRNQHGWYWFAEDLRAPTLWDAAAAARLVTVSVHWPVSVGAPVTYNLAQYWSNTLDEPQRLRALSTPGLLRALETRLGAYPAGEDNTVPADSRRADFAISLIEGRRPRLSFFYAAALDDEQHRSGPYSAQTFAVLEALDTVVGRVRQAAERAGGGRAVVVVVSDHGSMPISWSVHLNAALREAGLIDVDEQGRVRSYRAYAWSSLGSAGIVLQDPRDGDALQRARAVMEGLRADPAAGVRQILDRNEAARLGGYPDAAMVVMLKDGYEVGLQLQGPLLTPAHGGTHGYAADHPQMAASFLIVGPGVPAGWDLGRIDMRDIAPTIAARAGLSLPQAQGRDVLR